MGRGTGEDRGYEQMTENQDLVLGAEASANKRKGYVCPHYRGCKGTDESVKNSGLHPKTGEHCFDKDYECGEKDSLKEMASVLNKHELDMTVLERLSYPDSNTTKGSGGLE